VVVVVLVAVVAVVYSFAHSNSGNTGNKASGGKSATKSASPSTASSTVLRPVSATAVDNSDQAAQAIDGSSTTEWHSQFYIGNPVFGGLKKGTGLLLNLGKQVKLSQVQVQFSSSCCTAVNIDLGNSDSPASESGFSTVASSSKASGTTTFTVSSSAKGQYVLLWFTSLPPLQGNSNEYEAQVYNVVVRGTS
jgi:hypothetical protein